MIQLRIRTEGSFGATFAPISRIIQRLKEIGCTAAGIVDQSTWLHVKFFEACKEAGIQPLLGVELVVSEDEFAIPKMWFLARNKEGLSELYRWSSRAHQNQLSTKRGAVPRLTQAEVGEMSDNIVRFAGDVTDGDFLASVNAVIDLNPSSRVLNMKKRAIAAEHGLQTVSTGDNAFCFPEDKEVYELISKGGLKPSPQFILETLDHQDAAKEIADSCAGLEMPVAPMIRIEGDLLALCREGIEARVGARQIEVWTDEYEKRMLYELDLIKSKDFESYFLMVADLMTFAKKHMLVGPARGSSAGSLVCYLTRITEIDPIPPKLYFERFIDISRSDLPDIDTDFPDDKRHLVFEYAAEKYGQKNTAKIGTISLFKPKSALIQVCKSLNIPPQATAAVKVAMIERSSADSRANNCLEDTLTTTEPGRAFIKVYPQANRAALIEGHAQHTGVHAAGLLVCNDDITNYCTVDSNGIAHIEKGAAEKIGLLKVDVLGLRTLGILDDSGVPIDWYNMKFDDPAVYEIFNKRRLCAIFQFEGNALRAVSSDINFKDLNDIDAVTALARPGPFGGGVTEEYVKRKNGKQYAPIHPLIQEQLKETFGLPVYQEQTMAIVRNIGKFSWKDTSVIRKAMSKRMGKEFFDKHWDTFKEGAAEQGIGEAEAKATWDMINSMGAWAFNKAHSYSYAVISYWTAYLKAHHPLEFAAANLRSAKDEDSATELLREMAREGIQYKAFDIDLSDENWSVKNGMLIGGFMALKGFGESKAKKFVDARNSGKLTAKQRADIEKAENSFADIFPINTKYGDMYLNPGKHNIMGVVSHVEDIKEGAPHGHDVCFVAELIYKNARDINEEVNIKKRGGKIEDGPRDFLDLRLRDDTGTIGGRIGRKEYEAIGKELLENVPVGAILLVRAKQWNGIKYAFIQKWKRLDA